MKYSNNYDEAINIFDALRELENRSDMIDFINKYGSDELDIEDIFNIAKMSNSELFTKCKSYVIWTIAQIDYQY
jgi:transposase